MQLRCCFEHPAHLGTIQAAVGLRPGRLHRRPTRPVKQAKLYAGTIDHPSHYPAESVHLAYHMSLGDAADRRIARHLADQIEIEGHKSRARTEARGRRRRLTSGVARTDHDHIKTLVKHIGRLLGLFAKITILEQRTRFATKIAI